MATDITSKTSDSKTSAAFSELEQAIHNKTAKIGVIGLGYVGLPLIRAFISAGYSAQGFDVDQKKVDRLKAGQSYIAHVPQE